MDSVDIDPYVLALLAGLVIPLITGLFTKLETSSGVKRFFSFVLSALAGALAQVVAVSGHVQDLKALIVSTLIAFGASAAAYYGVWKPVHVTTVIQEKTPNIGL